MLLGARPAVWLLSVTRLPPPSSPKQPRAPPTRMFRSVDYQGPDGTMNHDSYYDAPEVSPSHLPETRPALPSVLPEAAAQTGGLHPVQPTYLPPASPPAFVKPRWDSQVSTNYPHSPQETRAKRSLCCLPWLTVVLGVIWVAAIVGFGVALGYAIKYVSSTTAGGGPKRFPTFPSRRSAARLPPLLTVGQVQEPGAREHRHDRPPDAEHGGRLPRQLQLRGPKAEIRHGQHLHERHWPGHVDLRPHLRPRLARRQHAQHHGLHVRGLPARLRGLQLQPRPEGRGHRPAGSGELYGRGVQSRYVGPHPGCWAVANNRGRGKTSAAA